MLIMCIISFKIHSKYRGEEKQPFKYWALALGGGIHHRNGQRPHQLHRSLLKSVWRIYHSCQEQQGEALTNLWLGKGQRILAWHRSPWRVMLPLCQNSWAYPEAEEWQGRHGYTKVQQSLKYHSWCLCFNSLMVSLVFYILHARNGWLKRLGAFL